MAKPTLNAWSCLRVPKGAPRGTACVMEHAHAGPCVDEAGNTLVAEPSRCESVFVASGNRCVMVSGHGGAHADWRGPRTAERHPDCERRDGCELGLGHAGDCMFPEILTAPEPPAVLTLEVRGSGPAFLALLEAATAEGLEVRKIHVHVERGGAS